MATTVSFVRIGSHERDGRARFAVLLGAVLAFAVYKSVCIGFDRPLELLLGIALDSCVWMLAFLLSELTSRLEARGSARDGNWSERLSGLLFYPSLYLSAGLVFAHTWFFDAAIERRLTVLDVTLPGVLYFFSDALPRHGYLGLAGVLVGMHLAAYLASINLRRPDPRQALLVFIPLVGLTALGSALLPRTPSVLFDTGQELWQLASLPGVTAEPSKRAKAITARLDRSAAADEASPHFSKVIVLVMETMTEQKLATESKLLPPGSFVREGRAHMHRYTRYFPNNQDSRTGMLDMLMSRLIPYEAYNDADVRAYQGLAQQPSLVDRFAGHGYKSAFAVSQVAVEEVVSDLRWDERLNLTPAEIERARGKLLCFSPDEWENGCEDLALLPKLIEFVKRNERAFVYQEFIWGHDFTYNSVSGKTNTAYYSGYVDALLDGLDEAGVADDTLLVLTSDHGFRDKSLQGQRWVYEIPLIFYASRFSRRTDARLFSHVDFVDLLFHELAEATTTLPESPLVMIVGPTGSGMVTSISSEGDFTLLRRRGRLQRLLERRERAPNALTPGELLYLFESYRATFDSRLR